VVYLRGKICAKASRTELPTKGKFVAGTSGGPRDPKNEGKKKKAKKTLFFPVGGALFVLKFFGSVYFTPVAKW